MTELKKKVFGHKPKEEQQDKPEKDENSEKPEKADDMQQKVDDLNEQLKRAQADFINYKNRCDKESKHYVEFANAELIRKMLPAIDSFELALKNTKDPEKFREGMQMVFAQLMDMLKQEGLRPIDAEGQKFDPYMHEVLLKEKSDKPEDTILQELQKGYMLKDKVLRHSKVKISE